MAESKEAVALELTKLILSGQSSTDYTNANSKDNILAVYRECLDATIKAPPTPDYSVL